MTSGRSGARIRRVPTSIVAALAALVLVPATDLGAQGDPTRTPATNLSADGRSGTDGTRTLTVSQSSGLAATGQAIRVTGSGYDANKGIYVALCVIPPPNVLPTPCGGGVDIEGQAGASQWISSNPPSYGVGLARPYGPGGTFDTTFSLSPVINPTVDCRFVRCAVLTRNDHTRSSDRSQDILIPVTFSVDAPAAPAAPGAPPPAPAPALPTPEAPVAPAPAPSTTAPTTTTTTTTPAPAATLAEDGRSVSDGARVLRAEAVESLDPSGQKVAVSGEGHDSGRGIYVSLCATSEGEAPGPCSSGEGRSGWISSNPPEWGQDLAIPFEEGGEFELELELVARIDADTDCLDTTCALVVRSDDTAPEDRSLDLALPVSFATDRDPDESAEAPEDDDADVADVDVASSTISADDQGSATMWIVLAAVVTILALAAGSMLVLRRRQAAE